MKINKLMATALCAVALLTGCSEPAGGSNSSQSSSAYSPHPFEESSSSTEAVSSVFSSSSTSLKQSSIASTSPTSEPYNDPRTIWFYPEVNSDDSTIFSFTTEDNGSKITFSRYNKMVVYESSNSNEVGSVIAEKKLDPNSWHHIDYMITVPKSSSTKYYRMRLEGDNIKSQFSNVVEIKGASGGGSGSSSVARYTHTFTAPSYLTVIPDYSDALALIEQGKEPKSFSVSVQFICPGCGTKRTYNVWLVEFPYSSDGKMPFTAECGLSSCPYRRNRFTTTIESHAVRIS